MLSDSQKLVKSVKALPAEVPALAAQCALDQYLALLTAEGSPLLERAETKAQVEHQFRAILASAWSDLSGHPQVAPVRPSKRTPLSTTIGHARATSGTHPAHSLFAAAAIFEAAYPALCELCSGFEPDPAAVAVVLNRVILSRMAVASMAYVDVLLGKAQSAHRVERYRVSRELHDVAAPAVAVALQYLELASIYRADSPTKSADKDEQAKVAMLEVLEIIRGISKELREDLGKRGLVAAMEDFFRDLPASAVTTSIETSGDATALPPVYQEELFLLAREAARNAIRHGNPTQVSFSIAVTANMITVAVRDDGTGFVSEAIDSHARSVGLSSMTERAEMLGGSLRINTAPGEGTTVTAVIPRLTRSSVGLERI